MTIATFNVNSIRSRVDLIVRWLKEKNSVDILCLQELKCEEAQFPKAAFEKLGYHIAINGQMRYNGVAVCSKFPFTYVKTEFGDTVLDEQKRLIEVQIGDLVILNVYAPHGESDESDPKHLYKMAFYDALTTYLRSLKKRQSEIVVLGDLNVALSDHDVYDPAVFEGQVGFLESEKEKLRALMEIGLRDCYREKHPDESGFTWWDYRTAAIWRNEGMRIDYILATDAVYRRCKQIDVDLWTRRRRSPTPSDHAPLVGKLSDAK
ncbi:MAG: exodeoxyribonuclease III [Campylobacteraceae bacterium 4484_4]|nr:MAG: exodeoxyribonuclease III [Campylobacteraceae bacterium 4484_4]